MKKTIIIVGWGEEETKQMHLKVKSIIEISGQGNRKNRRHVDLDERWKGNDVNL